MSITPLFEVFGEGPPAYGLTPSGLYLPKLSYAEALTPCGPSHDFSFDPSPRRFTGGFVLVVTQERFVVPRGVLCLARHARLDDVGAFDLFAPPDAPSGELPLVLRLRGEVEFSRDRSRVALSFHEE